MTDAVTSNRTHPTHPLSKRELLKFATASLTLWVTKVGAGDTPRTDKLPLPSIMAVRVWPATDYTRVTLEHDQPIEFTSQLIKNPERLVVDIEGIEFNAVLQSLPSKIIDNDPYIKLIRAGRNRPGVVRLVIDLKAEIKPQIFSLKPVGNYGHRLVLDLYPAHPIDPLMALLEQSESASTAQPDHAIIAQNTDNNSTKTAIEKFDPAASSSSNTASNTTTERGSNKNPPSVARLVTIMLDPGHGGEDPGAIGRGGSYEKNVTLSVARRLKEKIDAVPNMRAVLTRDGDFFIPLNQRVQKARKIRADLFVSVHADAFIKPTARGSSVFVLSERGASSSAARWLAKKENEADLIGGASLPVKDPYLARTLLDLSQTATNNDSIKLGQAVLGELGRINTLHKAQVEQAGFAVLKAPDIPSILIETAFISNPEEEKRLNDDAYQDQLAMAILRGLQRYFAKNPPLGKSKIA
ncbi:MAG: N-acetylmuramoyl-L-alanine amidase [Rugosibacter sp.]|nr:N-acetylmuramoyl-L-alanine amidase [Rugosibacter sp.]HQN45790.1 N-acetylmuramoyl-L-alanine amidase [Rugosibacter sp.]